MHTDHAHAALCCPAAQTIMLYFQMFQVIKDLPISWMPGALSQSWEAAAEVFGSLTGTVASLDCLFQAWGLWQGLNVKDIVTSVLMRALVR